MFQTRLLRPSLSLALTLLSISIIGVTPAAMAQTGVSDDRVSLPDGPGSLDGVGDNVSTNGNMGLMSYSIPIKVPQGVNGMTPGLGIAYSSGGGNGPFGMGWGLAVPSIERMTSKGLPEYIADDRFVADGGNELVRVSDAEPAVYRARYEGAFIRYSWIARGTGDEGYWTAEYPNGAISYFGADRTGTVVETARVRAPDGVFRYLLVDSVDPYDNRITYDYRYYGAVPLLDFVGWVYRSDGTPRFSARFDYEVREDPISDARGGFNERTAHRATDIRVFSEDAQIRRYSFSYEDYLTSGGVSRLVTAERFGADAGLYGVRQTFEYSRALAGVCDGVECDAPILVQAGSIGAGFATGRVNLIDLNGDSLPDAVLTPPTGPHQVYLNEMDATDGSVSFASPFDSAVGDSGSYEMSSPFTQVLDVDGDGFTDLLDTLSGRFLVNKGTGDWDSESTLNGDVGNIPDFSEDFALDGENELTHIRFTDIDGDRKIDVLRSDSVGTSLFRNLGLGGFVSIPVDEIEAAFSEDATDLADVNGDGLLDPVQLRDGVMRYRLSLGRGKWAAWTDMADQPFSLTEIPFVEIEDLNGDGLDDVLLVQGSSVRFALNRNNAFFSAEQTVTSAGGEPLPNVDDTVTVLYADMNGNGSNDVVWVDDNGVVTFLDLFPVRPHLLSRIENGVGYTADVTYGSMARERARDGGVGWDFPVPMATLVVNTMDVYAMADDPDLIEHELVEFEYAGGYYDGIDKAFRGFATSVQSNASDDGVFRSVTTYDVGIGDNRGHFAGLETYQILESDGVSLQEFSTTYAECTVGDVPVTTPPIQWACETASETIFKEGAPQAEWATMREEMEYDGYGNVTRAIDHGVVDIGGNGCTACTRPEDQTGAPCGAQCVGDERYVEADFIAPDQVSERYVTTLVQERRSFTRVGGLMKHDRFFFDGDAFVGLPGGQAARGAVNRVSKEVTAGVFIDTLRSRHDSFGNTVEALRAGGGVDEAHHSHYFMSDDGRDDIRVEEDVVSRGETHTLALDISYDPVFGNASSASGWYIQGEDDATERQKAWAYDEHGRLAAYIAPGNSLSSPSEVYTYELTSPYSRIITRKRSEVDGPLDIETISCVDGLGRELQSRGRISDNEYLVSGYAVYDRAGNVTRSYDAFNATSGNCGGPPADVKFTAIEYDGLDREIRTVLPDGDERGTASFRRMEYLPLASRSFNEDDNDPDAPGFDTPTTLFRDGQSRLVATERPLPSGGVERYEIQYDDLGRLSGYKDPNGGVKTQRYNLLDRVVEVIDPDAGIWSFEYTDAGDLLRTVDGRGVEVERTYDSMGRKLEEWDVSNRDETLAEYFYDKHPDCPTDACTFAAGQTAGSRSQTAEGVVTDGFGFDKNGDPIHQARQFRGMTTRLDRVVDNAGRVTEESYTGGHVLRYTVDPLDRPTSIAGIIDSISFTDDGQVESYRAANGIETAFSYDDRKHLVGIRAGAVLDLGLTRDRNANITDIDDSAAPSALSSTAAFTIDALMHLVEADYGAETVTFETDAIFRTTSKVSSLGEQSPVHVGNLTYGDTRPRAVTDAGGVGFAYDAGGFVTTRGDDAFDWDHLGRIRNITRTGANILSVERDGSGGRALAKIGNEERQYLGRQLEIRDGIVRLRVRIGDDVVAVLESASEASAYLGAGGAGAVTAADAFEASESEAGTRLRSAARRLLLDVAGETTYHHGDHLGSTLAVSDADGTVRERFAYYAYGAVRATSAIQSEWASYSGVTDDGTGYLDYRNRMMSPREGRWLSPDPLYTILQVSAFEAPAEAFAAYSFVANNPTTTVDIDGFVKWAKVAKYTALTVSVVAGVAAAIAITVAGAGVVNIVGAVIGGVVTGVIEAATIGSKLRKARTPEGKLPTKKALKIIGAALGATALGALSGFSTGGLSAVGTLMGGGADLAESHPKAGKKTKIAANIVRVAAIGVGAALGAVDPAGATASAGSVFGAAGGAATALEAGASAIEIGTECVACAAEMRAEASSGESSTTKKKKRTKKKSKKKRSGKKNGKKGAKPTAKASKSKPKG